MTGWQPQGYDPRQQRPGVPPQWQQRGYPPAAAQSGQPQEYEPRYQPSGPPPRRQGGGYGPWIAGGAVVLAVVAGGAFYVLHGHGASAPPTCAQQYQAWKTGPANAPGKQLEADAAALSKAGEDIPVMTSGLKAVGADATALEAYPMPACADPAGYWTQYLGAMKAAGDNAGSASGLGGIILAEAPLKQVPAIQSKLTAELAKTAGVKAS